MTKCVAWPHKVVYATDGRAAVHAEILMPFFVHRYLIVWEEENQVVRV